MKRQENAAKLISVLDRVVAGKTREERVEMF